MTTTWILIANASEAHIYSTQKSKLYSGEALTLEHVYDFSHPQSRLRCGELFSDRSGRRMVRSSASGTYSSESDLKSHEADHFAKELAKRLKADHHADLFQDLIVAAPPHFHGLFNKYAKKALNGTVSVDIEKDYTKFSDRQLLSQLKEYI